MKTPPTSQTLRSATAQSNNRVARLPGRGLGGGGFAGAGAASSTAMRRCRAILGASPLQVEAGHDLGSRLGLAAHLEHPADRGRALLHAEHAQLPAAPGLVVPARVEADSV